MKDILISKNWEKKDTVQKKQSPPPPIIKLNKATVLAQKVATASDPEPVLFTLYPVPFTVLIYKEVGRKYHGCTNFEVPDE